jgi:thioredoxin reductase
MSDAPFDIAVLGAGPAGGNAALAADAQGLRVVLLDEQPAPGGQVWRAKSAAILRAPLTPESKSGDALRDAIARSTVTQQCDTRVWHIARKGDLWQIETLYGGIAARVAAKSLILANGAREVVQPVPGWTTPGVVGLAGATALFKQNLMPPGKQTIVSGTGPLVFFVAHEIRRLGGVVVAVVTPNEWRQWAQALPAMLRKPGLLARGALWMAGLAAARVPVLWGHAVTHVDGKTGVTGVTAAPLQGGTARRFEADSLCLGNGLIPQVEAAQMLGVPIRHDPSLGGWVPKMGEDGVTDVTGLYLCGDGTGIRGADAAVHHGRLCGLRVAADHGCDTAVARASAQANWRRAARFGMAMTALSLPDTRLTALATDDTIICRCESLTRRAILAEINAGAESANAVKSGVRAGMGPCGGKYCQSAITRLIALETGVTEADVPPPSARPPLRPVPVAAAAGAFAYDDLPIPKPAPL